MRRFPSLRSHAGMTLIEVLAAMTILLVGVMSTIALIDRANATTVKTRSREAANSLTRELIEGARSVPYERLTATGLMDEIAGLPGLEDTPPGGAYGVERRDVSYTVTGTLCAMDDPRDGAGTHADPSGYCAGTATVPAGGTATDSNPEDYKRVSVTVRWQDATGTQRTVTQAGIINNPGAAGGPAVRSVGLVGVTSPYSGAATTLSLDVTTSSAPNNVQWFLDGVPQPSSPTVVAGSADKTWRIAWDISTVLDGPYVVSAEALDATGLTGATSSMTVQLNRHAPAAPTQVAGGFTAFGTVEVEWASNLERDIIGYELYRQGETTPVCPRSMETTCTDPSPPATPTATYRVVAFDTQPNGQARASAVTAVSMSRANLPPSAPPNVLKNTNADGSITLQWTKSPGDPDAGDGVDYYRIYRDGVALGDRYARWYSSDASVVWTDTSTGGDDHDYWVTAVDRNYAESDAVQAQGS